MENQNFIKKLIVLLPLLILCYIKIIAQDYATLNSYRDAFAITNLIKQYNAHEISGKEAKNKFEELLTPYVKNNDWKKNPFLKGITWDTTRTATPASNLARGIQKAVSTRFNFSNDDNEPKAKAKPQLSNITSFNWQAVALHGAADFMAKRLNDEVTNYSIHLALKKIEENSRIATLFPKTYPYITSIIEGGVYYSSDLSLLKYNAEYDLKSFPENSFNYLELHIEQEYHPIFREAKFYYTFINDFRKLDNPVDGINNLSERYKKERKEIIHIQLLNNAFRDLENSNKTWVSYDLIKDEDTKTYFLGLLLQQLKNLPEQSNEIGLLLEQLEKLPENNNVMETKQKAEKLVNFYSSIFTNIESVTQQVTNKNKPTAEESKEYLISIYELYKPTIISQLNKKDISNKYANIVKTIPLAIDMYYTIEQKQYKFILPQLLQIAQYTDSNIFLNNRPVFQAVTFLVDVNMAQSSSEIKDLLEATALPIGSASIKRTNRWSFAINGYVGVSAGSEWLTRQIKEPNFNYGLTAPIGISFSHKRHITHKGSFSVFLSVLDIGSLVNQNLSGEIDTDTKIKFEQFLAPGIGLFHNIGKTPLTWGIHITNNPSKREIEYNSLSKRHIDSWRANLSLMVDIPVFNLYVNNKKKVREKPKKDSPIKKAKNKT